MPEHRVIGGSERRIDVADKVTGRARYADDLVRPRMLHCRILRSRVPHAELVKVDVSAALDVPGVLAAITALPSWGVVINNAGQIGLTVKEVEPLERAGLLTPLDTNSDGAPDTWYRDLNGDGVNDLIVDIGAVQNLNGSALRGLNDGGSAVGYSWNATGRIGMKVVSFLWENGQLQTLSSLTGGVIEFRFAKAINNARQILTEYYILLPIQ